MKLLNFFKEKKPKVEQSKIVIHTSPIGSTGTEVYSGYIQEEYLNTLLGTQRADIFDKMRRGDPQIKMCLAAVKSPLKSATWSIEPYDQDDEQAIEDAEIARYVLMEGMRKKWGEFVSEALTLVDFGHSVFEVIDKSVVIHPDLGPLTGIDNIAFRSQRTIEQWHIDRDTEELSRIAQYAYGDTGKVVDIPADHLLTFVLEKEGANYEGISALRCCYGSWLRKNMYLKLNAIGVEKFAVPTPVVKIPPGAEKGEQYSRMQEVLQAYLSHEKGYLTYPEGWEIKLESNAYDPAKVETSIDNEDKRIVKSFLANFLELGMNGFGSQSLSFDLSDFFLQSIDYIANGIIADEVNKKLIPRIIKNNRGPRAGYPYLKVTGISDKAGEEFSRLLQNFVAAQIITPDDKLEENVRNRYGLPEMSEDGRRDTSPKPSSVPMFREKVRKLING